VRTSQAVVLVLCTLAGGLMVVAADLTTSYVPLFFAWVAFLAIPLIWGAMDRARRRT
jgi:hypothetical protein